MSEVVFIYDGQSITIQCDMNQKMRDICTKLSKKINMNLNSLIFLYGGMKLNLEKKLNEITKEDKITILAFKDENEIYLKYERILNNSKKIDEIILLNNEINDTIIGLKYQIENIINNIIKNDINYINTQLKNMKIILNKTNEDIKKINDELNMIRQNGFQNNNINKINENISNDEKINSQKIINENNELKVRIKEEKNKNQKLINKNDNLEKKINDLNNEIEKMKNKIKTLKYDLYQKDIEIQNYTSEKNDKKNIITSLKPGEKVISVVFLSMGRDDIQNYSLPCKNTDLFVKLEERLYEDYPEFKNYETYFEVNARRILRFKTIEENNIRSNSIINVFIIY